MLSRAGWTEGGGHRWSDKSAVRRTSGRESPRTRDADEAHGVSAPTATASAYPQGRKTRGHTAVGDQYPGRQDCTEADAGLENIYEPLFLDSSYGFRSGRGCHDAIKALYQPLYKHDVQTVIDIDLANYFGTIAYQLLGDKRFIRYLLRMFKAGVLADGELKVSDEGLPQGSICSPVLANIFAHYVLDTWFEDTVKGHCRGRVELYRYGGDAVICCQYEQDARRIKEALGKRLAKYHLRLNEERTRLVPFSKRAQRRGEQQGAFDFLGFTFYLGRSRRGAVTPKLKTSGKRLRSKLKRVGEWARKVRNVLPLNELWSVFVAKLRGHIQYYAVSFNGKAVKGFHCQAKRIMFQHLNRRSQRKSFNWARFQRFVAGHPLAAVRICHALY